MVTFRFASDTTHSSLSDRDRFFSGYTMKCSSRSCTVTTAPGTRSCSFRAVFRESCTVTALPQEQIEYDVAGLVECDEALIGKEHVDDRGRPAQLTLALFGAFQRGDDDHPPFCYISQLSLTPAGHSADPRLLRSLLRFHNTSLAATSGQSMRYSKQNTKMCGTSYISTLNKRKYSCNSPASSASSGSP